MQILLKVDDLYGGYGRDIIIEGLSFTVNKNDFLGIIGPNGSGKSTLLRLISKVLIPQKGKVYFDGKDITQIRLKEFAKKVAFVEQDTLINFSYSVWEIVLMGRIPHLEKWQLETKGDYQIAKNSLSFTGSLHLQEKAIDQLSAGERQRVIISKALCQQPRLLFLDEPTSHLDICHQIEILDLLKRLNRNTDLTVVIVLHDLNLASEYCNRLILLEGGRIYKEGTPNEILTYQNIEAVYKTIVVVKENPISSKPYIILVSKESKL